MHVILDYGVGNLDSVYEGLKRVGIDAIISKDVKVIESAKSLILPGVGAFGDAMDLIKASGFIPYIKKHIESNKYLLGICLGMQLLFETSYEYGTHEGLGFLEGEVISFNQGLKVPHMGWNDLSIEKNDPITQYIQNGEDVYFVHSYYVKTLNSYIISTTSYGVSVPAIVKKNKIYGMQFHPEKSGDVGYRLLKAYKEVVS